MPWEAGIPFMKLSVVMPAYNERPYIEEALRRVVHSLVEVEKEIIIINDGSNDGTGEWLTTIFGDTDQCRTCVVHGETEGWCIRKSSLDDTSGSIHHCESQPSCCEVKVLHHPRNLGKGACLRAGFSKATGDVLVVQDADLEYDPRDWEEMWTLFLHHCADVVFGSRFYGKAHRALYFHHFWGNKLISNSVNLLCNVMLSDIECCYKMFRREVLDSISLYCSDFGFEVEFTVKVAKQKRWRIYEVGIRYYGRTYAEGKKVTWQDGLKALWYVARFRFLK